MSVTTNAVSRRTLARGAAWAAPAVVVAAAAPHAAASLPPVRPPSDSYGCKYAGGSTPWKQAYRVKICFTNTERVAVRVVINAVSWAGGTYNNPQYCLDPTTGGAACNSTIPPVLEIPAGGQVSYWTFWDSTKSAQANMTFGYTVTKLGGCATRCTSSYTASTFVHFDPDCGCTNPRPPYPPDTGKSC